MIQTNRNEAYHLVTNLGEMAKGPVGGGVQ